MHEDILGELEIYAKTNHIPILSHYAVSLLRILVTVKRPLKVLEIGTAIGYSSIIIKDNAPNDCMLDTIEKNYDMVVKARENIAKAGHGDRVNIIYGDAVDVLMSLNRKYDIIFMDAAKNEYNEYLKHSLSLLNENALLVADNVLFKGLVNDDTYDKSRYRTIKNSLRQFIDDITDRNDLITSILDVGDGIAVSLYKNNGHRDGK
jgi:predicted O-methyltransferase YrrM